MGLAGIRSLNEIRMAELAHRFHFAAERRVTASG